MPGIFKQIAEGAVFGWLTARNNRPDLIAKREARAQRKAQKREQRRLKRMSTKVILTTQDGETIEHTPPTIPLRTATKATLGSVAVAYPGWQIVQFIQELMMPWPWLEDFTNGPAFVWLCATIIPLVFARFTKSPIAKQAL